MEKIPASVGILTYNSASTLARALESVKDFDDIVITDGGSTDTTLEIAKQYGARIIMQDTAYKNADGTLKDFAGVRNQCLDAAKHDWFLYIDSDETISDGLHADIARIAAAPVGEDKPLVYRVPIGILMDERVIKHSSNYPGYQHRFFNTQSGARFAKPVHERIYFDTKKVLVGTLAHPWYVHSTRSEWEHYFAKNRKYRDIEVRAARNQSLGEYLRWSVFGSIKTSLGVVVRASGIYLMHGFKDAIPVRGELGRALYPLALLSRMTAGRLWGRSPAESEGDPVQDTKTWPSGPERDLGRSRASDEDRKLFYVANNRIPTSRAHGVQIASMCSAFASAGAEVTLLLPRIGTPAASVASAYGVDDNFTVRYLPVLNFPLWIPGAFQLRTLSFARAARRVIEAEEGSAIVYTRGEMVLFFATLPARFIFAWESHIKPGNPSRYQAAIARADAIIAITKYYAAEIPQLWGIDARQVLYAPDGVSLAPFANLPSKEVARTELGLPRDVHIALYAGSDLPWKGLSVLREASELLPEDALTVFVGDIKEVGMSSHKRLFAGPQPYSKIPFWLAAADALVLTGDPSSETARYYTSPLKLFEYMAAGRPIVATDLPSTRDILDDESAYLVQPEAPALAGALMRVFAEPQEAESRARKARILVAAYSWESRAARILDFISRVR